MNKLNIHWLAMHSNIYKMILKKHFTNKILQTKVIYSSHLHDRVAKLTMTYILAIIYKEY